MSRIADELPESEVKHLKEAEDIINFPISLYFAEQAKIQETCFMMANEDSSDDDLISVPDQMANQPSTSRQVLRELPVNSDSAFWKLNKTESLDSENDSVPDSWEDRISEGNGSDN